MSRMRRGELYRDPSRGKIAGVCAGLATYFDMETWLVRILVVSGVLLGMGSFFIVIYIAGWLILDKKPTTHQVRNDLNKREIPKDESFSENVTDDSIKVKSRIWQAGEPPKQAFHDIKLKFTKLERQLRGIEHYVTSPEFTVSREINKL